jgi:hypothetical protein
MKTTFRHQFIKLPFMKKPPEISTGLPGPVTGRPGLTVHP